MTPGCDPDAVMNFLAARQLPRWHLCGPAGCETFHVFSDVRTHARRWLCEGRNFGAALRWLPAICDAGRWPSAEADCVFPWAIVHVPANAPAARPGQEARPDVAIRSERGVDYLHPIRWANYREAMQRAFAFAAMTPYGMPVDPLGGVPLPGSVGVSELATTVAVEGGAP
jgi:hypothetical protein